MSSEEAKYDAIALQVEKVETEVRGLRREISELRRVLPVSETLTASEIITKLGISQSTFYKPWNMPNFGKSDISQSPRRWMRNTVDRWYATPEEDRRARWESMTTAEKAKFR
jgi:predicted DNA-binding transcriptional regulator AlpA